MSSFGKSLKLTTKDNKLGKVRVETVKQKMMGFKQGDVVVLNSGGPEMTVKKVIGQDTNKLEEMAYTNAGYKIGDLVCQWFIGGKLESGVFSPNMVDPADDE